MPDPALVAPRRVLLIQTQRLGDVVLSTALLEQLTRAHPDVRADWLVGPLAEPLLESHPLIGDRLVLDADRLFETARLIRSRGYDWIVDVQGSWRTALVTGVSGARVRIGWKGWNRGWAYTRRLARASGTPVIYVVRDRARLLAALGVPSMETAPRLYLAAEERAWGEETMAAMGTDRPRAGMLVSTSHVRKDWPPESFAAVARALAAEGVLPVVLRAPGGAAAERAFMEAAGDAAVLAPPVPLRGLMALLAACDVFVSGDTGPAHIATALGVPRVTIHGPTPAEGWTPDSPEVVAVRDVASRCPACAGRARASEHSCLLTVTPEMVIGPVRSLLQRRSADRVSRSARSPQSDTETR